MILGSVCTRNCAYCNVEHGIPKPVDEEEAERIAELVSRLGMRYVVITSVTRDDLADYGAGHFARVINAIRRKSKCRIEVLVPDFKGKKGAIEIVAKANPDVFAHNIETVRRFFPEIRNGSYECSMKVLKIAKEMGMITKSGIIVGMGETMEDVLETMRDLRHVGCDILTIGQYLKPVNGRVQVEKIYSEKEFEYLRRVGMKMGFAHVEAGMLVRSSYNAMYAFEKLQKVIA